MGIKDLFDKNKTGVITKTSLEEEVVRNYPELESDDNVWEQRKRIERFIPHVDFSDPSNFARYGSAEAYYEDAITRIYNQYPYDGTAREIQKFMNESNYVDLYIFENRYPRTTGYINLSADGWGTFSNSGSALTSSYGLSDIEYHVGMGGYGLSDSIEYIKIVGGPHTSSGGITDDDLRKSFGDPTYRTSPNANIYDSDIYSTAEVDSLDRVGSRESNLKFDLAKGVTTEFWLNKGEFTTSHARGSIVVGTATPADLDAAKITLTSTDGTSEVYLFDAAGAGATGTLDGSEIRIQIQGLSSNSTIATQIAAAINHENGHDGKITATTQGNNVYLVQAIAGTAGNTTITETVSSGPHLLAYSFSTLHAGTFVKPASAADEVIFDLWNGAATSSVGYGRLLITLSGSENSENPFKVHLASGSNVWDMTFGASTTTTASIKDTWNHVAFTFYSSSVNSQLESEFYLNGNLLETQTSSSADYEFGEVTGSLIAYIGALQTAPSGNSFDFPHTMAGYGKLSGSLDEFRYWKTKKTERDVKRNWWTQVRGGTNTEIANTELGVYYKFNEGIAGTSSIDANVLDYSGRISNGVWKGYPSSNARSTGSAIDSSTTTVSGTLEFKDPIIYSSHPDVETLFDTFTKSGSAHDDWNVSSILDSMPAWIVEEDEASGGSHLKKLSQIIGSYFDTLHLQIENLPKIQDIGYPSSSYKPVPFSERLLSSQGLYAPETFVEASILEKFANRRDDRSYSLDINDVKNQVYQNIYNNLIFMYKSKGTEKSLRNLVRCYGVDDEVIKLNAYGNNSTFKFDNTHYDTTVRKKYIDFNHPDRFDGTVYQNTSSDSNTTVNGAITYISGTNVNFANTAEVEAIFPNKMKFSNANYFITPFTTSSIFGCHTACDLPYDFNWIGRTTSSLSDYGFQIYAVKTKEESNNVWFALSSSAAPYPGIYLTSSVFSNVYDNQKWNFAVRFKDGKYPYAAGVTGSDDSNNVVLEFTGYNVDSGVIRDQFYLSTSGLSDRYLDQPRRYFVGADRTNFTGSISRYSDIKASSVRHWAHYLDEDALIAHAKDPDNIGVLHANKSVTFSANSDGVSIDNMDVPEAAALAMHWDFSQVTSSGPAGEFEVEDAASGSVQLQGRYSNDGNFSHTVANMHAGKGYFPSDLSSGKVVDKNYVPAAKQRLPEVINSNDAVNVLTQDDDLFPSDPAVSQTFFAFEKSMYGVISQEMINTFATVIEFNNLVGEMTNKYREGYKDFDRLRLLFFEKIQNDPDLDKFIDYYKWIDNSLSVMIQQLVPASADVADEIRTVVESHIFERNKYRHKVPLLDYKGNARWGGDDLVLRARAKGIGELSYDWKRGHPRVEDMPTNATASITITDASLLLGGDTITLVQFNDGFKNGNSFIIASNASTTTTNDSAVNRTFDVVGADEDLTAEQLRICLDAFPTLTATRSGATVLITALNTHRGFGGWYRTLNVTDQGMTTTPWAGEGNSRPKKQGNNALWWKERAEKNEHYFNIDLNNPDRELDNGFTLSTARQSLHEIIRSFNSASYDTKFSSSAGTAYHGSTYALRQLSSPVRMSTDLGGSDQVIRSGYNFPRKQKPQLIANELVPGSVADLKISTGDFRDIHVSESGPPIIQVRRKYENNMAPLTPDQTASANLYSPVAQYSSSATTGYLSDTSNVQLVGHHVDAYGEAYEVPMQGPFSQHHVGGYQHRHADLTVQAELTGAHVRPEAWEIHGGNTFTTRSTLDQHPPAYAHYHRDGLAKRPMNVKNIMSSTGSSVLGNYYKTHEVVQTVGRSANNSSFVKNEGFTTSSLASPFFPDILEHVKPVRSRVGHVIVNRFSAPGGPETAGDANGGPFLDLESAEYSPYNNMNFRNLSVRQPLQSLLTEHNNQFGYRSGSSEIAAIYKVNRNPLKRLVYSGSESAFGVDHSGSVTTASAYDNFYVQHMIPRSDRQYSWITASVVESATNVYGYLPSDGLISSSNGMVSAISFLSASEFGAAYDGTYKYAPYHFTDFKNYFIPVDFAGMNTIIVEPISASDFTLGCPTSGDQVSYPDHAAYFNFADLGRDPPPLKLGAVNQESFIAVIHDTAAARRIENLNAIIHHRQGPYGYPTWKQIRVGQGALARYYRKNNLYTNTPHGGVERNVEVNGGTRTVKDRRGTTLLVSQSVLTTKYRPIKQELLVVTGEAREKGGLVVKPVMVQSSYANNIVFFDRPSFTNNLGIEIKKGFSAYDQIKKLYLDGGIEDPSSPVVGINRVLYSEIVWPSHRYAHTRKVRGRTDFRNNFWRTSRTDRTTDISKENRPESKTALGLLISQSVWHLDAQENFTTLTGISEIDGGTGSANATGHRAGQLQNEYVHYHAGTASMAYGGVLYARKQIYPATRSVCPDWGIDIPETASGGSIAFKEVMPLQSLFRGEALWEANNHAGKYEGTSSIFSKNSADPFYDSYDKFFSDIKGKGKDYSIIPEFRISEHLEFYRNSGNDFLAENEKFLTIPQTTTGSDVPQNSAEPDFFRVFTNSDFMKYFEVIRKDHKDIIQPHSLTLQCKAIKKFVPYDGFYPAQRTVEIAKQFMDSYGDYVTYVTGNDSGLDDFDKYSRNFMKPMFAPGILYNTIKAGLAVDYPILENHEFSKKPTLSFGALNSDLKRVAMSASYAIFSNSKAASMNNGKHTAGWDKRLPFETLIHPERYLANTKITDDEPSKLTRVDATVRWSGQGNRVYRNMMHNFLAESVNFFLKGGKTTRITSRPEREFKPVTPGSIYGMRIKLWRSMDKGKLPSGSWGNFELPQNTREVLTEAYQSNFWTGETVGGTVIETPKETFTMYSRPSAFGPPLGLIEAAAGETSAAGDGHGGFSGSMHEFDPRNGVYCSHTPPYYDGEAWIDLIYFPRGLEITGGIAEDGGGCGTYDYFQFSKSRSDPKPFRPTLSEIFAEPNAAVLESSASNVPLDGTYVRKWRYDREALLRDEVEVPGPAAELPYSSGSTYHTASGTNIGPASSTYVNEWAMQGDASLNIFDSIGEDEKSRWVIQTKFETPMLNFNKVTVASGTLTVTDTPAANSAIPRGMWHQFGRLPLEGEGVYMQVTDIPEDWLKNHPSASLKWSMGSEPAAQRKSPRMQDEATRAAYWNGYSIPIGSGSTDEPKAVTNPSVKSLVDICGFDTDPVRIGEIANRRRMHEAIVAVPFVLEEGERQFFTIPDPKSPTSAGLIGRSIGEQIERMGRYVIPPALDFITNPEVTPVAMYIFEFSHSFSKDDLSHMWQNLPPKLGTVAEESTSVATHDLLSNELLGDWVAAKRAMTTKNPAGDIARGEFPDKLRWMVFKVKQKAKVNYYEVLSGKEEEAAGVLTPDYTFNWPYDQCSVVELAQIEAEVEFGEKEISPTEARLTTQSDSPTRLATQRGASSVTAASGKGQAFKGQKGRGTTDDGLGDLGSTISILGDD